MLMQLLYPYIKFIIGNLYPAYKTWKALKRKDETTRRRWMKYWVSFSAYQAFESISDLTLAYILPFYLQLKLICVIWLVVGTKVIFDSIVNRELSRREKAIDRWLNKFSKARYEMIALLWFEISRNSLKILTLLMSGGLSVLLKSPEESNLASPTCSDREEEDETETKNKDQEEAMEVDAVIKVEKKKTVHYVEPDFNENTVSRIKWGPTSYSH